MVDFSLHERLAADCHVIGDMDLCRALLLDDERYPWVILVPMREALTEVHQMTVPDQHQLMDESCQLARFMAQAFRADKMNLGALGNLVPQLHFHHVCRYADDPAWPGPVWGHSAARPYDTEPLLERLDQLRYGLGM